MLSGLLAASWIRGVQSHGISACPKHFVGNDAETSRTRVDCRIDERALHEIYLAPFELALSAHPWTVMTAYNRVNGTYASEHTALLRDVLKGLWGSDAVVISDWTGVQSTTAAVAGLDVEMPGPPRWFGARLAQAVLSGELPEAVLDDKVARLARLSRRTSRARRPQAGPAQSVPPVGYGRQGPPDLLTRAAAAGFVLLKNDAGLLPLATRSTSVLAVLGPNAVEPCYQGWGSARVAMGSVIDPVAALTERFAGTHVVVEPGCSPPYSVRQVPLADLRTPDGEDEGALLVEYLHGSSPTTSPAFREVRRTNALIWDDDLPVPARDGPVLVRARAVLTPARTGGHAFSVRGSGPSRILLDGREVAGLDAQARPHDLLAAWFTDALGEGRVDLCAGRPVHLSVEMVCEPGMHHLLQFGIRPPEAPDLLDRAVAAARGADVVVLVVGTNSDVETESRDQHSSSLPGAQDDLVDRVLDANPSTVVVVNAGRAVDMPWASKASTILYSWLPGHAFGPALAAVLAGDVEPGGRLPVTIAAAPADYPAYATVPGPDGRLVYEDSYLVGYRGFDANGTRPAFCFGHGIGYTDFSYEQMRISTSHLAVGDSLTASVVVRNTGTRAGKEVVQLYASGPSGAVPRPSLQLAAFAAVTVPAGAAAEVHLEVDRRRLAYWDTGVDEWRVEAGDHVLHVGRSSRDLRLSTTIGAAGGSP